MQEEGRRPLSEQTAIRLRSLILDEHIFEPGKRIPDERSLSKDLGVSRTSLREAIKLLVAEGVLEIRRGIGTFVTENPETGSDPFGFSFTKDKRKLLSDWYHVRLILESEAMELVAENASDQELENIYRMAEDSRDIIVGFNHDGADDQGSRFLHMDQEFHRALAEATHSIVMRRILPALHAWVYYGIAQDFYPTISRQMEQNAIDSHIRIAELLRLRDGRGANLAMRYHMDRALRDITPDAEDILG